MMARPRFPFLDLKDSITPLRQQLINAATRVIDSGRYIGGEEVQVLEQEICRSTGAKYAVAVSNGLDALRLSWRALIENGLLSHGDKVMVPANTYIATILAISDAGLQPVCVDPDPHTMLLGEHEVQRALTDDIKAIAPVHLYGAPAYVPAEGMPSVEDAAQALGATAASGRVGSLGTMAAISFYPTKNIGALGDAGCVTTNNRELADTVRALANYGSDRRYHNIYRGFNCRMDPIQAAMLRVKLKHLNEEIEDRNAKAALYRKCINHPAIECPPELPGHVYHQFVVKLATGIDRDIWRQRLLDAGVETDVHYAVPPHKQPCYSGVIMGNFPATESLADRIVSLPIGPSTSQNDVVLISEIINQTLNA